jgi:predicted nucleic acid-binding protein
VIDANVAIALCAQEASKYAKAKAAIARYSSMDYQFCAPEVIVSEVLYVLCCKLQRGELTVKEYDAAVVEFDDFMTAVAPPAFGEKSLIVRAEQIRDSYGCSRSSDSLYIALAEQMAPIMPTELVTFDTDLPKQAARHAPTVVVNLIKI